MLKSTHKVAASNTGQKSLPAGWKEHKAPSGHSYYYNSETKQSTYTRPTEAASESLQIDYNASQPDVTIASALLSPIHYDGSHSVSTQNRNRGQGIFRGGHSYQDRSRRSREEDRPKSRAAIPNCQPWFLVKTKLGRRFVHNADTKESFWKFPQDVMMAVIEMDRLEWEAKKRGEEVPADQSKDIPATASNALETKTKKQPQANEENDSDSYEEVEVTDDEDADDPASKRPRTEDDAPAGPVEFNEDDIAYQLAQMGEDYGLDPGEYDNLDEDYEEGEKGLPLSDQEAIDLFENLLDDFRVNPYTTMDKVIEEGQIIEDNRYTILPNMSRRREVFSDWSRDRIQQLQEKRAKDQARKRDPKVEYLKFLSEHATTKLYWPEFKRKFRKDDIMKDMSVSDKDREKLYREFVSKLKSSEGDRKKELIGLLRGVSLSELHRGSTLETLPDSLVKEVRFWGVQGKVRDELVTAHISTLADL